MKKIIYILLLTLSSAFVVTSCTEEEVKPQADFNGGGSGTIGDITK
jgi:hypothetical protein